MTRVPLLVACIVTMPVDKAPRSKRRILVGASATRSGFPPARAAMSRAATSTLRRYFEIRTAEADFRRRVAVLDREVSDVVHQLENVVPRSRDEAAAFKRLADLDRRRASLTYRGIRVAKAIETVVVHIAHVRRDTTPCTQATGRAHSRARVRRRRCSASRGSRASSDDGDGGDSGDGGDEYVGSQGRLAGGRR